MTRFKSWVVTDISSDVWLDSLVVNQDSLRLPIGQRWSIRKRTLRGGLRDGIDLLEVENGALSFSVLPTRGMGIWRGEYRGNFLGWHAPVKGPVHPKFVNLDHRGGLGWLTGFDELLCRCGLASNGPPGVDVRTDGAGGASSMPLTLHGRIANQPAHYVEVRIDLERPHEMSVIGRVAEGGLFFPHLHLTSTISTLPGWNRFVVHDVVENRGAQPTEMQMLYHCNIGPPFLEVGSRLAMPSREVSPISQRAAKGIARYDVCSGPTAGFAEQVYCMLPATDSEGRCSALLYSPSGERGLCMRWNQRELPCFTLWKNTAAHEDGYVTGLEPGTNFPNPRSFERKNGRVQTLEPGARWECTWSLEVLDSRDEINNTLAALVELQSKSPAMVHRTPQARISSQA
ncbi:MAG TPA: aldose 1-epimerase family protein [Gemmataceae bacterium]|jgi:hypothetical protein|nr:aldose 1-epimerase family protein [Gemmataceae bacterium]